MGYSTSRKNIENKIKIDFGMPDYFKFYKKKYFKQDNSFKVEQKLYNQIVSSYNEEVREIVLKGLQINFPYNMGALTLIKYKPELQVENNKITLNKLPINAKATRDLWDSNPEAKEKKVYIRYTNKHTNGYVFKIMFSRNIARFKNKSAYDYQIKREFKREVPKRIQQGKLDTYELKR